MPGQHHIVGVHNILMIYVIYTYDFWLKTQTLISAYILDKSSVFNINMTKLFDWNISKTEKKHEIQIKHNKLHFVFSWIDV